jgi:hypothetical protein
MHASIWTFTGDPDDLLPRFDAVLGEAPVDQMHVMLTMRAPDGLIVVDTCPTREAFESFRDGEWLSSVLDRHGLPRPTFRDYPLVREIVAGALATV